MKKCWALENLGSYSSKLNNHEGTNRVRHKDKIIYLPFAPGIPWRLRRGKYVVPEMAAPLWRDCLNNKKATVVCFGGLIETYFSFSILESINYLSPNLKLSWAGPEKFKKLCEMHGLATYYPNFDGEILDNFPTPIFFDKRDGAYFNCLNNYLTVKSYYGTKGYTDKRIIAKQITEKNLIPWDEKFIPNFKQLNIPKEIEQWIRLVKLHPNLPTVIVIPEKTEFTNHNLNCLNWTPMQVKALGSMLKSKNINTIVFSNQPSKYYDPCLNVLPIKLEYFWYFVSKSSAVLSCDIDFLLLANMLSRAKLFTNYSKHQFDLKNNSKFFNMNNVIYKNANLVPSYVFENIIENI